VAVTQGVSYSTVLRWHEDGVLPVPTYQVGRLVVIGTVPFLEPAARRRLRPGPLPIDVPTSTAGLR